MVVKKSNKSNKSKGSTGSYKVIKAKIVPRHKKAFSCRVPCDIEKYSYKNTCRNLWDANCSKMYPKYSNKMLQKAFYDCYKRRLGFKLNCTKKSCWDRGHDGAIMRMKNKREKCGLILNKK